MSLLGHQPLQRMEKDHAWAGQLESYLNTKEDDVRAKVKLCWSSLFTPRAIFYRFEKGATFNKNIRCCRRIKNG